MTAKAEEIKDRLGDQLWRLNNLYYIEDKHGNVIPFKINESQMKLYMSLWYLNIILKDRQRGFSTFIAIFILDTCLFNSNTAAGIIDITLTDAKLKLAKIKLAYNKLPSQLKERITLVTESKTEMEWSNGSRVSIGTSHRGGTLQLLHISEMGKIAARFPDRAREIRTGALNTVAPGCFIFNESTAEGQGGEFYDDVQTAIALKKSNEKLTKLDFRFHFFAWWMGEENELDPEGITITPEYRKYFDELEKQIGITLSGRKKAWYVKKADQQKDDMKREYPGTPEEAFEAAIEGAYLGKIITRMRAKNQITAVPFDRSVPVNTGWDYGLDDHMAIWFHQRIQFQDRLIGYLEGCDEDVLYYWSEMQRMFDCLWGYHFLPHDFNTRRGGTALSPTEKPKTLEQILIESGMRNTKIIPRIEDKRAAINETKLFLPKTIIDKTECARGIDCLSNFRREWDEINGKYKETPLRNWAKHGYDACETLARGLNAYGVMNGVKKREIPKTGSFRIQDPSVGY